jgi:hypothetical protein
MKDSSAFGVSTDFENCLQPFHRVKDEEIKSWRPRRRHYTQKLNGKQLAARLLL